MRMIPIYNCKWRPSPAAWESYGRYLATIERGLNADERFEQQLRALDRLEQYKDFVKAAVLV